MESRKDADTSALGGWVLMLVACCLLLLALLGAGCAKTTITMPVVELPRKPASAEIPCEDLHELEEQACILEGEGARNVCRKVQRNYMLCTDQQEFTKDLYRSRNQS